MAPSKVSARPTIPTRITTRSKKSTLDGDVVRGKRKADASPSKVSAAKRSAFGDMTNAFKSKVNDEKSKLPARAGAKKVSVQSKVLPNVRTVIKGKQQQQQAQNENLAPPAAPAHKVLTRQNAKALPACPTQTALKPKDAPNKENVQSKVKTRLSNEFEKTGESLYSSALEEVNSCEANEKETDNMSVTLVVSEMEEKLCLVKDEVPDGVTDFDKENLTDVFQVSHYAMDIFKYMKSREPIFTPSDYMGKQEALTQRMRTLLVEWMVEIQESFELNHETLYLGVKMVDLYLSKKIVSKETLQLVGAAAMFIASKYDERLPPLIDDFLYVCDGAYKRRELLRMEINLLKTCNFDLGMPLSYRFLRRYARCAKVTMPILTLARFILELSLLDYATISLSDSKLAAAALFLALQMKKVSGWTETLEYYTGYKLSEIADIVRLLNVNLHRTPKESVMTVRNKYSHKIFYEVANTQLISNKEICF